MRVESFEINEDENEDEDEDENCHLAGLSNLSSLISNFLFISLSTLISQLSTYLQPLSVAVLELLA